MKFVQNGTSRTQIPQFLYEAGYGTSRTQGKMKQMRFDSLILQFQGSQQ